MDKPQAIMPVYIVNEDTWELTQKSIQSLGDVELTIIDNGSTFFYPDKLINDCGAKTIIRNNQNLGYAKAVNQGLKLSHKGLVAVANNDIKVSPNWVEVAREVFKDPTVYSMHPRMIDYGKAFTYGSEIAYTGKERWCSSSFFVIHNQGKLLLYDENFLNSYDDYDYWHRVRRAGYKTVYTDMCCYQHKHSFTQKQIVDRNLNDLRNLAYFKSKWGKEPEELFKESFPDQWKQDYWKGFDVS